MAARRVVVLVLAVLVLVFLSQPNMPTVIGAWRVIVLKMRFLMASVC